ncbi:hypothetical protein JCM16303_002764 [Sporobolomyces ruberrimus]
MADPSTPARTSSSSSSPPRSSSASTPATSTEKPKQQKSTTKPDEPMPSSELEVIEVSDETEEPTAAQKPEKASSDKKRKAPTTSSKSTVSKKPKTSSSSSSTTTKNPKASTSKTTTTTTNVNVNVSNEVVGFKNGKLEHKQKNGPKADALASYLIGRAAFIEWAVEFFKSDPNGNEKLPEIPPEHLGAIAKDVQEASHLPGGLARFIRNNLASSITENMSALEDSQEDSGNVAETSEAEKDKKDKILDRINVDALKATIENLATRTNYGLSLEDCKDGELPEGVSSIPPGLQFWVWEVQDTTLLSAELVPKFERRRTEREEIKRSVGELFRSLDEKGQVALLMSKKGAAVTTSTKEVKAKGKGKAKAETSEKDSKAKGKGKGKAKEQDEEEEPEEEGEDGSDDPEGKDKKDVKMKGVAGGEAKGKKKKELSEEVKAEKEEKLRIKAEKEAEKEEKRKEREAKKAIKAEKDAVEEEKKAAKRKEKEEKKQVEEKKLAALKTQKNLMNSFFVKTSPVPSTSGSVSTPAAKGTPGSGTKATSAANSPAPAANVGDFARIFHPFTVRPGVKVAPINRFNKGEKRVASVQIDSDSSITLKESQASFVSGVPKRRIPPYNPRPCPAYGVRELVVGINDSALTSQDTSSFYEALKDREKVPVKFFKFLEDVRPGYVGTWSKTSKVVTPRTPFEQDRAVLNYEIDSEGEWEEEPEDLDAENVGSDGEGSNDEDVDDNVSEADSWLADDDEIEYEPGYEADGDIVMMDADSKRIGPRANDDDDDDIIVVEGEKEKKERVRKEKERKKKQEEKQRKRKAAGPLLPFIKGPVWEDEKGVSNEPAFNSFKIRFLNDSSFGINPLTFHSKPPQAPKVVAPTTTAVAAPAPPGQGKENIAVGGSTTAGVSSPAGPADSEGGGIQKLTARSKPFPEHLVKRFLFDINGSEKPREVIIDDFVRKVKDEQHVTVTKTACATKWKEMGIKKLKGKMCVSEELLSQHGLRD